jgi:hypothetical protein
MPDSGVDGSMADGGDSDAEVPDSGDTTAFCPGAAVPTDSFDDDVVGGHWTCWGESAIEVTESGGALHFAFEDGIPRNGEHQCRWEPIAIGGRQFTLEIADIQAPANVSLHFRIRNPGTDLTDDVVLHRYESQMFARARVAGTQTTLAAEPFTNASHRFWRFREAAGEISFEVSGDGRTFRPLAVTTPSFDPTTAAVVIGMYAFRRVGGAGSASIASLCAQ